MYRRGDYRYKDSSSLKSQVHYPNLKETWLSLYLDVVKYEYFQIIEIPYQGGETSLVVVLPHEVDGIKELQEQLKDPFILDNELNQMKETELDLYLPKFKIETTIDLKDALEKVVITLLFILIQYYNIFNIFMLKILLNFTLLIIIIILSR